MSLHVFLQLPRCSGGIGKYQVTALAPGQLSSAQVERMQEHLGSTFESHDCRPNFLICSGFREKIVADKLDSWPHSRQETKTMMVKS